MTLSRVLAAAVVAALALTLSPATAAPPVPSAGPAAGPAPAAADDRGAWRVDDLGDGRFAVRWTSPVDLPVRSDRPTITGAGLAFGPSTTGDDGRTVQTVVTAPVAPAPAGLDVLLSGDRLDEPGSDTARVGTDVVAQRRAGPLPGPDPAATGPYAVVRSDYDLPAVKLPGMPEPIEMVGHVVEPAADAPTGPRPLVLFLHGRHSYCYDPADPEAFPEEWPCAGRFEEIPSHLGYDYVQRTLASQGFATVSVRVNGINAQDDRLADGGADARAAIVRRHLDHWTSIAVEHLVDLSRVVLVGHSRGGEGVDRASIQIPASAPYRIVGQVLLAPTDFASHTAPYVPTVTVLPYCDGDVYDLQGQRFTDVARDLDPADGSLKSSVLAMGANHNFFNSEWTPGISAAPSWDDWSGGRDAACGRRNPGRLTAAEQRQVGRAYIAGAVGVFAGTGASYLPLFDGAAVTPPSVGDADVRSHAIGGGRQEVRPGIDAFPSLATGADTQLCTGIATSEGGSFVPCGRLNNGEVTPHWTTAGERTPTRRFLRMTWGAAGAVGGLDLVRPLDLSARRLELRTIVDPRRGDVALRIRLSDDAGGSAVLEPESGTALPALLAAPGVTKLWAQPVLVDPSAATGVDLTRITRVEILGDSPRGQVFVADLSAAPAALPATPTTRMPQVSVRDLRLTEGDAAAAGPRGCRSRSPAARSPGRRGSWRSRRGRHAARVQRVVVDVAAGQTSGSIPVEYVADRTDDPDSFTSVTVWPLRGLATDRYLAHVAGDRRRPDASGHRHRDSSGARGRRRRLPDPALRAGRLRRVRRCQGGAQPGRLGAGARRRPRVAARARVHRAPGPAAVAHGRLHLRPDPCWAAGRRGADPDRPRPGARAARAAHRVVRPARADPPRDGHGARRLLRAACSAGSARAAATSDADPTAESPVDRGFLLFSAEASAEKSRSRPRSRGDADGRATQAGRSSASTMR